MDAIIVGTGSFADVAAFYLQHDSDYRVAGFARSTVEAGEDHHGDRPLFALDAIQDHFDPASTQVFVAVGYRRMNDLRLSLMDEVREKGFGLLSFVSSRANHWIGVPNGTQIGENVFIFEDNTLQPFTSIGDGTILWSGNHLGHHSTIGRGCFISSHVVISGECRIGDNCFIGVNASIADTVAVGNRNLIGPGAFIQKSTKDNQVFLTKGTNPFGRESSAFFR
jgi:sugar O-acyltransferase (sialic acid O-acetyltransferase NeuD family)